MIEQVVIVTFCRDLSLFYGASLVFDTIRIGFPEANILVLYNGELSQAEMQLRIKAQHIGAEFQVVTPHRAYPDLLNLILLYSKVPTAIVDPDVVFWDRADSLDELPLSGREIPAFHDPYTGCYTKKRLHTSFLKLNSPEAFQSEVSTLRNSKFEWHPTQPYMCKYEGSWVRYDVLAAVSEALPAVCAPFGEETLNQYDHLFCGTHIDLVVPQLGEFGEKVLSWHEAAQRGDYASLRGIWKLQQEFFEGAA